MTTPDPAATLRAAAARLRAVAADESLPVALQEPVAALLDAAAGDAQLVADVNGRANERQARIEAREPGAVDGQTRIALHDSTVRALAVARALLEEARDGQ